MPFWRAEVCRLALYLGEIPFEDVRLSYRELLATAGPIAPFGQFPFMEVDGRRIAFTGAMARYCGDVAGLTPEDKSEAACVDMIIDACSELTSIISVSMREENKERKLEMRAILREATLPKWFSYLEKQLKDNRARGFFVGEKLTVADIAVWRLLGWITSGLLEGIPKDVYRSFQALTDHQDKVEADPRIRSWMTSHYSASSSKVSTSHSSD
eukprot:766973-Hanusia_phi.AAC.6